MGDARDAVLRETVKAVKTMLRHEIEQAGGSEKAKELQDCLDRIQSEIDAGSADTWEFGQSKN